LEKVVLKSCFEKRKTRLAAAWRSRHKGSNAKRADKKERWFFQKKGKNVGHVGWKAGLIFLFEKKICVQFGLTCVL
jgi:hypothetical protein